MGHQMGFSGSISRPDIYHFLTGLFVFVTSGHSPVGLVIIGYCAIGNRVSVFIRGMVGLSLALAFAAAVFAALGMMTDTT